MESGRYPRQHPVLRLLGRFIGLVYILVTLLFGPIKSVARWLARQTWVQAYRDFVGRLPPGAALGLSLLALGLLEVSKIAVLLAYERAGLPGAAAALLLSKASMGYFAHLTWMAARASVVAAYPRVGRVEAWVLARLAVLRQWGVAVGGIIRAMAWYPAAAGLMRLIAQGLRRMGADAWRWLARQAGRG